MNPQAMADYSNPLLILNTDNTRSHTQLFHSQREEFILWCRLCRDVGEPAKYWKLCGSIAGNLQEDVGMYVQSLPPPADCGYFIQMARSIVTHVYYEDYCLLVFDHIELLPEGWVRDSILSLGECVHPYMSIAYLDRGANTVSLFRHETQPVHVNGSAGQLLQLVGVRPIETKLSTVLECGDISGAGE